MEKIKIMVIAKGDDGNRWDGTGTNKAFKYLGMQLQEFGNKRQK